MAVNPLRTLIVILIFAVLILLGIFTNLDYQIMLSVAIIGVFLIIFTFVFTADNGHMALNVAVIVAAFIFLPAFILLYLGVPDWLPMPWAVLAVIAFGALAVYAISKLNFVEIEFFDRRK